jgi:hypothetical protein
MERVTGGRAGSPLRLTGCKVPEAAIRLGIIKLCYSLARGKSMISYFVSMQMLEAKTFFFWVPAQEMSLYDVESKSDHDNRSNQMNQLCLRKL